MSDLVVEKDGPVEIVTLNRPDALNAVSPDLARKLRDHFEGLSDRLDVRVILLRAAGSVFCSGAELGSDAFVGDGPARTQRQAAMQRLYSGVVRAMRACPQPIVALVQGAACGAGFSLTLASDVRIAAPQARFNAAYFRIGLGGCDMGSGYLLPRLVGLSFASEMLMTGAFVGADRAHALGLVSRIVEPEHLLDAGMELARQMLRGSPMGLRLTKETLGLTMDSPGLEAALALEDRQQVMLLSTVDHSEAVSAFRERRDPEYGDI